MKGSKVGRVELEIDRIVNDRVKYSAIYPDIYFSVSLSSKLV